MLGIRRYKNAQIDLWQGDITTFAVDAMINATDQNLSGLGGVDLAIQTKGGPELKKACIDTSKLNVGETIVTTAGQLPAKLVIHTVGPIWDPKKSEACQNLLAACYSRIFQLACNRQLRHISIPAISTGSFQFPRNEAAHIAFSTLKLFLDEKPSSNYPHRFTFVAFDSSMYDALQTQLFERFPDEIGEDSNLS